MKDPVLAISVDSSTYTVDATAVRLEVFVGPSNFNPADNIVEERFTVEGVAKRDPRDKPNPEIAHRLALARAMRRAAEKIERPALGLVKHADDMAQLKKRPAKKRAVKKKART